MEINWEAGKAPVGKGLVLLLLVIIVRWRIVSC